MLFRRFPVFFLQNVILGSALAYRKKATRVGKKTDYTEAIETSQALVRKIKEHFGIPGMSVAVSVNGRLAWKEGFGYSDVENGIPFGPQTVIRIASISKSITTAIMAQLIDEKQIDIDAPVQNHVSEFPKKKFNNEEVTITTRHLASNSSGIRDYRKDHFHKESSDALSPPEFYLREHYTDSITPLNLFKDDPLEKKPGSFLYTTFGFTLLAAVLERAANRPFTELLRSMFELLDMRHTYLDERNPLIMHRCKYYRRVLGMLRNVPYVDNSYKWGGGGLLSTVEDLLKFGNAVFLSTQTQDGFLQRETAQSLWQPIVEDHDGVWYGLGWFIVREPRGYVYHTGGAVGASSVLLMLPGVGKGKAPIGIIVAIVANLQECKLKDTAVKIALAFEEASDSSD